MRIKMMVIFGVLFPYLAWSQEVAGTQEKEEEAPAQTEEALARQETPAQERALAQEDGHNYGSGWHFQFAASASPYVVYGVKTHQAYAAVSVLPEIRVKRDFGRMAFAFGSVAWGALSAITKTNKIEGIDPSEALTQALSSQPISFYAGIGLDVTRASLLSAQTVSLGFDGFFFALGYSNFKLGDIQIGDSFVPAYDRGFTIFIGVSLTALSINLPDED